MQASLTEGPLLSIEGWGGWAGCDAAVACEVVEHVTDTDAFARCLLGALRCVPQHRPSVARSAAGSAALQQSFAERSGV